MGGLMLVLFVIRFFVFHLHESPKFLMGRGLDAEAVEIVHKVAAYNGTTSNLTLDMLRRAGQNRPASLNDDSEKPQISAMDTSKLGALRRILQDFGWDHITPLFRTRKLAWSTSLLITLWGTRFLKLERHHLRTFNILFSPHRPRFPTVRQLFYFQLKSNLRLASMPRYNSFVTYLYVDAVSPVLPF